MSRKGLSPGDALRRTQKEKAKKKNKETRLEQRAAKRYFESPDVLERDVQSLREATADGKQRGKRREEQIRKLELLESQIDAVKRKRQHVDAVQVRSWSSAHASSREERCMYDGSVMD